MNVAAEFEAALPQAHTILGLRLLPLSLGRYRLLKRFESPFVDDEPREIQTDELVKELFFNLLICGLPVAEFKALLGHPKELAREARRFGETAQKVIAATPDFSILNSIEQFRAYLAEATSMPWHVMPRERGGGESVSHWSNSYEVALRSRVNWTQEQVDEEPMQKAMVDFFTFLESEGLVNLISHESHEILLKTGEDNFKILLELQNANAQK